MARDKENYNAWMRAWRKKNKEKVAAVEKRWRTLNPDKVRAANTLYRLRNPEKERLRSKLKYHKTKHLTYLKQLAYARENPERRAAWRATQKAKNPERFKQGLKRRWKRTLAQMEEIAGRPRPDNCEVCGRGGPIYFDHCHFCQWFRGWLCRGCNTVLGLCHDDPEILLRLIITWSITREMTPKEHVVKYSYKDVPTLREFSECNAFLRCVLGPFGSGKSSACAIELIARGLAQKPGPDGIARSRFIIIRNTYRQLNDSTIRTMHQWFPPHIFGTYRQADNSYTITAFENVVIELLYRALDRPDHVGNLLSLEVTGGWVNEAREVPWAIIEALQGRVGRYPAQRDGGPTWWGVIMDSNPCDTDAKMYKFFCETEQDPAQVRLFMQPDGLGPAAENLKSLPGGQTYYTRMAMGKDPEWVKVYCRGGFGYVNDGRAIFTEYYDSTHCSSDLKHITYAPIYRGWDFGLTPCAVFAQLLPSGQFIVFDEMVSESMGIENFSDEVLTHCTVNYPNAEWIDIGDPAGTQRAQTDEKTCYQILQAKGIEIEPGLQSSAIRLESVRKPLTRLVMGKPGFQLHSRCKMLRKGFMGGYQFRRLQTSGERFTSVPDKNAYSHPMDALQYIATRLFGEGLTTYSPKDPDRGFKSDEFSDFARNDVTGY